MSEKDSSTASQRVLQNPSKNEDPFSQLMAGVVNDTAVMYSTYTDIDPKKEIIQKDPVETDSDPKKRKQSTPSRA